MSRCCSAFLRTAWETHPHWSGHLISSLGKMILFTASNYDCKSIISSYIALPLFLWLRCLYQAVPLASSQSSKRFPLHSHFPCFSHPQQSSFLTQLLPCLLSVPFFCHRAAIPGSRQHPAMVSSWRFPPALEMLTEKQKRVIITERVG